MAETGDKVTRRYSNFRGVDLRGEECDSNRSPDSLNMWRNYNRLSCIETRPGLHKMCGHTSWIRSMMWHKGLLYFIDNAGYLNALVSEEEETVNTHESNIGNGGILFEFGGKAYAKGSDLFYCITEGTEINPTIPTTTIGRKPSGGGTPHQEVNMLSDYRKNSFLCDGESTVFYLDTDKIDDDYKPFVEMGTNNLLYNLEYGDVDIAISDPNAEFNTSYGFKTVKANSWMNKDLSSDVQPGYFFFGAETSPYETNVIFQIKIPEDQVVHISDFKNNPNNEYITFKWFVDGVSVSMKGTDVAKDGLTLQRTDTLWVEIGTPQKNISSYQNEFKLEILDALNSTEDYYDVDYENGKISFLYAPPPPLTDGQDNLVVTFKKSNEENRSKIMGCTLAQEFDNRMFFSGNPEYPNTIWHSALNDVTYFSDLDYYIDGVDSAPIRSMVTGNNGLWVFRDTQNANNGVFYHTPALDDQYGKVYPSSHSSISLGCSGKAINFNDDIVFFSPKGMEGITTDINTEQFATHRSSLVDRLMVVDNTAYKSMQLAEWRGYLLVFIGAEVYLADSRAVLNNENHIEYEWFRWNLGHRVTCSTVHNEDLYIATEGDGYGCIFSLTKDAKDGDDYYGYASDDGSIKSYWTTPKDYFGSANKMKTTNKKGCITEAFGDVIVSVKTDNDNSFEVVGTNAGIDDHFVSRIKRKKFKDIQLRFESTTGFRLESATLEAFIGGYIKR
jgi:hypothetical protein